MADGPFVVELLDRGELPLHLAEQLERWRQHGDLLALDELLHPPERVVCLIEIREGLTGPRQVVEGSRFRGDTNLRIDPRLPARPRRLALRHGVLQSPREDDSTSFSLTIRFDWANLAQAAGRPKQRRYPIWSPVATATRRSRGRDEPVGGLRGGGETHQDAGRLDVARLNDGFRLPL